MTAATAVPRFREPGHHTAFGDVLGYRLGKLEDRGLIRGDWLDLGCADGYYTVGLVERGADSAVGAEVDQQLVDCASAMPHPSAVTYAFTGATLPFADASFDGVLLNEVLEHVDDERATLREVRRVLRPGGHLAVFSPNRWFPFEGHGARLSEARVLWSRPVPLMPWLPKRLTARVATAQNYWPQELVGLVGEAGLDVVEQGWALALFEQYAWVPGRAADWYRSRLPRLERSPLARFLAVSTFIVACRPQTRD